MDKLLKLLAEIRNDIDFENTKCLIDDGILDSFEIVSIVAAINEEFDIEFPITEVLPENFNDVQSLYAVILRIESE